MNWRHIFLNASALALLFACGTAMAADEQLLDAPEVTISAATTGDSGFYLRGDLGYAGWTGEGTPSLRAFDTIAGTSDTASFDDTRWAGDALAPPARKEHGHDHQVQERGAEKAPEVTSAIGLWISLPGSSPPRTRGIRASPAVRAVIGTGASRSREPRTTASRSGRPPSRSRCW